MITELQSCVKYSPPIFLALVYYLYLFIFVFMYRINLTTVRKLLCTCVHSCFLLCTSPCGYTSIYDLCKVLRDVMSRSVSIIFLSFLVLCCIARFANCLLWSYAHKIFPDEIRLPRLMYLLHTYLYEVTPNVRSHLQVNELWKIRFWLSRRLSVFIPL